MTKKVLAICYTQSGQLREILDNFTSPLEAVGISVEKVNVNLKNNYAFPWTTDRFFSVMPDCQLDVAAELAPFSLKETKYDLIILGYQAWFLSPSIPFNSLMNDAGFKAVLKDTPVITVTGARNMWLNAFVRVKKLIKAAGATLVGNIALVDTHPNPVSFVTIFHWMLKGKKDSYLGIFPPPGVPDSEIKRASTFGETLIPHLMNSNYECFQPKLDKQRAVVLKYNLMVIETVAGKIFKVWATFISKRKNKKAWLKVFKYYLLVAFWIGAPIMLTLNAIFFRFTTPKRIAARKHHFLSLS
jgi:hypothetical protein